MLRCWLFVATALDTLATTEKLMRGQGGCQALVGMTGPRDNALETDGKLVLN